MKVLVDATKLRESYIQKPKKKRRVIRRGINKGAYGRPKTYTPEQDEMILGMKKAGCTYKRIGEELGRTAGAIRDRYYKLKCMGG